MPMNPRRSLLCFAALWVMAAGTARAESAGPAAKDELPQLDVAATPARVPLRAGEEWARVMYCFRNSSPQEFEVVSRSAFFHSLEGTWQSDVIGPIPTTLKLPALSQTDWEDRAWMRPQILVAAVQAKALADKELLLVQGFTLRSPDGETAHVSATIIFRVEAEVAPSERVETKHFDVTVLKALRQDEMKAKQLAALLNFADRSYDSLAEVLGFAPHEGRKVPLRITTYGGSPYYQSAEGGYVNIPCDVLESQSTSDWLWVVFPHELTHYFFLEVFPNPPRWFVEGPASFFGNKVSEKLGHAATAAADRAKILGWAKRYPGDEPRYLFEARWPEDRPGSRAGEAGSPAMGEAYRLCMEIEALDGADFFVKVFAHMRENGVSFSNVRDAKARNAILVGAMQSQSLHDLWAFFAKEGFQP